jgi:CBS domain-containing protein
MQKLSQIEPLEFEDPLSNYEPASYASALEEALAEKCVTDLKLRAFLQVKPSTSVQQVIEEMWRERCASVIVVDDGRVVGIFTERDVLERVVEQYAKLADRPVSEVMTSQPEVVYDSDPVAAALASIAVAGHRHVPVLGVDDCLKGVIAPRMVFDFVDEYLDA